MQMTITYKGKEITKTVELSLDNHTVFGKVGTAYVRWDKRYYAVPYVKYSEKKVNWSRDKEYKLIIKKFLDEYLFTLSGKTPLHFEESNAIKQELAEVKAVPSLHTSGVPLWARDEHKVWTECFKKDGSSYFRRTRYKKESKDLLEKYLPHCSACPLRSTCEKPCNLSARKELQTV